MAIPRTFSPAEWVGLTGNLTSSIFVANTCRLQILDSVQGALDVASLVRRYSQGERLSQSWKKYALYMSWTR